MQRAEEDLQATEQAIAALQQERLAKILEAPADAIDAIDRKIADQHRVATVYREQIAALRARLATEETEQRGRKYQASLDKIEKTIAGLSGVASEVEAAIRTFIAAATKFQAAQQAALKSWPSNVELPWADELGTYRLERIIHECFRPFSPGWALEAREHWSLECKLEHIREVIAEFAKAEADGYAGMIARLRSGLPALPDEEAA